MQLTLKHMLALLLIFVFPAQFASAQQQPQPRKYSGNGLKLEIAPLTLDQVRAFFIGRDFQPNDANYIAETGCIFRSAIGNSGDSINDPLVVVQLAKWRVIVDGQVSGVKTRELWAGVWESRGVGETPAIAFHWALFPTLQQYQPSDYNWGLVSFALPPGTNFDLELHWMHNGLEQKHMLKALECGK